MGPAVFRAGQKACGAVFTIEGKGWWGLGVLAGGFMRWLAVEGEAEGGPKEGEE
jgi:hypothetical protein